MSAKLSTGASPSRQMFDNTDDGKHDLPAGDGLMDDSQALAQLNEMNESDYRRLVEKDMEELGPSVRNDSADVADIKAAIQQAVINDDIYRCIPN